ncbi:GntR family transcriptional regulator [Thermolongibacillus altinsuensis]|uniref:GntR family transcriptional regulator n=1 Tax=Thermolongibacillus altinsuensis TaxID=575256 RepID=A0A4R1QHY4_9BACL|nr:GntR family transcriptional regulator [Thermolongibacillus altinsuensis]TCL51826.1 GntR family transcriptional regulator [Thermolongibacillus altinsuensis]
MATSKVYIEILWQIRRIIEEDGLQAGDRLPSERELSDRLQVGRSSVREALRALELLGLIETRRGEGTFIKEFGDHQLIHLLGTFILQGKREKDDLKETKILFEKMCLSLACMRMTDEKWQKMHQIVTEEQVDYESFFKWIVEATDNYLLLRIWLVLNDFFTCVEADVSFPSSFYEGMLLALGQRQSEKALELYEQFVVQNLSKTK